MLPERHKSDNIRASLTWDDLAFGAPTIIGLAGLCSRALAANQPPPRDLSLAAKTILYAARERAAIELKATKNAYDSSQRLLAVHVELGAEKFLAFRSRTGPAYTLQMLEGFRELCAAGLVMHHLGHDFALTHKAIEWAALLNPAELEPLLSQAVEIDFSSET